MTRITPPFIGQVVDTYYLKEIADAVNELHDDYKQESGKSYVVTSPTQETGRSIDTLKVVVEAGYKSMTSDIKNKGDSMLITYPFSTVFKTIPIVTATPQITAGGDNKDVTGVSTIISRVTKSNVTIKLVFDSKSGKTEVGVNIIAVGT